jgi:hypothetical protein
MRLSGGGIFSKNTSPRMVSPKNTENFSNAANFKRILKEDEVASTGSPKRISMSVDEE